MGGEMGGGHQPKEKVENKMYPPLFKQQLPPRACVRVSEEHSTLLQLLHPHVTPGSCQITAGRSIPAFALFFFFFETPTQNMRQSFCPSSSSFFSVVRRYKSVCVRTHSSAQRPPSSPYLRFRFQFASSSSLRRRLYRMFQSASSSSTSEAQNCHELLKQEAKQASFVGSFLMALKAVEEASST